MKDIVDKIHRLVWRIFLLSFLLIRPSALQAGRLDTYVNKDASYGRATYSEGGFYATCDSNGNCRHNFRQPGGNARQSGSSIRPPNLQQIQQTAQVMQSGLQIAGMINDLQKTAQLRQAQTQQFEQTRLQLDQQAQSMDQNYMQEVQQEKETEDLSMKEQKERNMTEKHDEVMGMIQSDELSENSPQDLNSHGSYGAEEALPPALPQDQPVSEPDFKSSTQTEDTTQTGSDKKEVSGGSCPFGICGNPKTVDLENQGASDFAGDPNVVDLSDKTDLTVNPEVMKSQPFGAGEPAGLMAPPGTTVLTSNEGLRLTMDVPSPQIQPVEPVKPLLDRDQFQASTQSYVDHANRLWEELQEGKKQAVEKAVDWAKNEVVSKIMGRSELINKGYESYQEMKDLYEKIGGEHQKTLNGFFEGAQESARELASPYTGGRAEERMEEFTNSRAEGYKKMAHGIIKDQIKDKLEEAMEEKEDEEEKSDVVPLLGLKSADRQPQEYLNRHVRD